MKDGVEAGEILEAEDSPLASRSYRTLPALVRQKVHWSFYHQSVVAEDKADMAIRVCYFGSSTLLDDTNSSSRLKHKHVQDEYWEMITSKVISARRFARRVELKVSSFTDRKPLEITRDNAGDSPEGTRIKYPPPPQ